MFLLLVKGDYAGIFDSLDDAIKKGETLVETMAVVEYGGRWKIYELGRPCFIEPWEC